MTTKALDALRRSVEASIIARNEARGIRDRFDREEAQLLKAASLDRVAVPARKWIDVALPVVKYVARECEEFTTDRVEWELNRCGVAAPSEKRAMGALMRRATRQGFARKTDRVTPSVMPSNHRRPKAVWRSLLYRQQERTPPDDRHED